jgi:hypothetical protein
MLTFNFKNGDRRPFCVCDWLAGVKQAFEFVCFALFTGAQRLKSEQKDGKENKKKCFEQRGLKVSPPSWNGGVD